jgi:hypothetical protein
MYGLKFQRSWIRSGLAPCCPFPDAAFSRLFARPLQILNAAEAMGQPLSDAGNGMSQEESHGATFQLELASAPTGTKVIVIYTSDLKVRNGSSNLPAHPKSFTLVFSTLHLPSKCVLSLHEGTQCGWIAGRAVRVAHIQAAFRLSVLICFLQAELYGWHLSFAIESEHHRVSARPEAFQDSAAFQDHYVSGADSLDVYAGDLSKNHRSAERAPRNYCCCSRRTLFEHLAGSYSRCEGISH